MQHVPLVQGLKPFKDLDEVHPDHALVDVLAALDVALDLHRQVAPAAVLHHDAQVVAVCTQGGGQRKHMFKICLGGYIAVYRQCGEYPSHHGTRNGLDDM